MEATLRGSDLLLQSLCAIAPLGIFQTDAKGRVTDVSGRWHAISGLTREESLGDGWRRAVHMDDRPRFLEEWASTAQQGTEFSGEYRILTPHGVLRWVHWRARAVASIDGRARGYVGTIEDVTDRRRAEDALRESEERMRFALRAANMVAWDWDLTTGRMARSESPSDQPEMSGEPFQLLFGRVHPEDRPAVDRALAEALSTDTPYDVEFRLRGRDGQILWMRDRAQVTFDAGGKPIRMAGVCVDVTEHKRTMAALHAGEKRFRALVEKSWDGVALMAPNGTIEYASPATFRLLGFTSGETTAPNVFELIHPDDLPEIGAFIQQLTGQPNASVSCEYRNGHRDGSWHWIEATCTNLLADPGVRAIVANFRDITERKQAEERLKAFAAQLERSNRELQEFAYVASHDLQEPLRKIEAFGDRLKAKCGEALGPDGSAYLERMQKAASRMRTLIHDLLAFSRVATKARPFVPVDLAEVAREVVSDLETRIEQTSGSVDVGDLPTIDADPMQMRQLLQNLIGNALKFHSENRPPAVKVYGQFLGDSQFQLSVEDNGIGLDEKYADRIFNPFQRLHGRGEYEGTGIGLAICRKIAERHGGSITVSSAPGHGATFRVNLPARQPTGDNIDD